MDTKICCTRCGGIISQERLNIEPVICDHCGHTSNENQKASSLRFQNRVSRTMIIAGIAIMGAFAHVVTWQSSSIDIIPVKFKIGMKIDTKETHLQLAEICILQLKHDCVIQSYVNALKDNPGDLETLDKLAKLQFQLGSYRDSMRNLETYFNEGGNSHLAAHRYAKLLQSAGNSLDAETYYNKSLQLRPDVLQITVSQDYVTFLKAQARYKEARTFITTLRKNGAPSDFMNKEFEELSAIL